MTAPIPDHLSKVLELIEDDQLRNLVTGFNRHLRRTSRKTTDRTAALYNQSHRFFIGWLIDPRLQLGLPQPAALESFTTENINAWLDYLREGDPEADPPRQPLALTTLHMRYRALRRFLLYLVRQGELDKSPTVGVDLPPLDDDDYRPMTLEIEDLVKLIAACRVPRGRAGEFSRAIFDGRRDELIIRMLGACGLRVSELCGIDWEDIDREQQKLTVRNTKSGKPRIVAYPDAVGEAIDAYERAARVHPKAKTTRPADRNNPTAEPRHPLLLSERGAMAADGVRWRLELLAKKLDMPGLHPHALRHTFAHHWLLAGGNENELKRVMGWAKGSDMPNVYGRTKIDQRAHMTQRRLAFGDKW